MPTSVPTETLPTPVLPCSSDLEARVNAAQILFAEILDCYETLSAVEGRFGVETLIDLNYLQQAVLSNGFVDVDIDEGCTTSEIRQMLETLPSSERWATYLQAN